MSDDAYAVVINGRTYVEMYAAQKLVQEARRQTRDKVLEEAAKVAERIADGESVKCRDALNDENDELALRHADMAGGAKDCAAAIRAMKEKSDD